MNFFSEVYLLLMRRSQGTDRSLIARQHFRWPAYKQVHF